MLDQASSALARRALLVTLGIGAVSSASGLLAASIGMVAAREFIFVACVFLFSLSALFTLLVLRKVPLQTVATATTTYYAAHMCIGVWMSLDGNGQHLNLFIYLLWFFPLLVINKLVNQPGVSRLLALILLAAPLLTILGLLPRWAVVLPPEQRVLLTLYCLIYLCYALTLNIVTRYREKYIAEQQRAESLKVTAEVFESISECFISLDAELRLIYLNDAACAELGLDRQTALHDTFSHAAPRFFSDSIRESIETASLKNVPTLFEAQTGNDSQWYDVRCFPRLDGMSIYFRDITNRKKDEMRIHYLAFFDVLTGLPNRQRLRDRLTQALVTAADRKSIGALLFINLDDFKMVNDTMGHETGDALLQQAALRLASCFRPHDIIARIAGDEFGVILEALGEDPLAATATVTLAANRVLELFRSPFAVGSFESQPKCSVGVTLFGTPDTALSGTGSAETVEDLFKRADLALYQVKAQGGNNLCFFDPALQTEADIRAALRADLRLALLHDQFTLYFQPQVDSRGEVTGSEALLRWFHPQRGSVTPSEFVPLAEEAGLIVDLGRWVLQTACRQLADWASTPAMKHLTLAVNVSVRQLLDPRFVDIVKETLRSSGADPRCLKLEITESSIMENVDEVIPKMTALKDLGVVFSLDDFGTGYSSLSYLPHLPLGQLKIDRSFVANVLTDERYAAIARTIIVLGRSLNMAVIAEGVETEAQRAFLMAEGCHFYQGFLFSPAIPAAKFEAFVAASRHLNGKLSLLAPIESFPIPLPAQDEAQLVGSSRIRRVR